MIQFETAQGKYLAVEVPVAINYWIEANIIKWEMAHLVWSGNPPEPSHDEWEEGELPLPEGTYTVICKVEEFTEDQKIELVGNYKRDPYKYPYFENGEVIAGYYCENAYYSFASLLRSHNIPSSALIIKIE